MIIIKMNSVMDNQDILFEICTHLTLKDLLNIGLTSKNMHNFIEHNTLLWNVLLFKHFGVTKYVIDRHNFHFHIASKERYMNRFLFTKLDKISFKKIKD